MLCTTLRWEWNRRNLFQLAFNGIVFISIICFSFFFFFDFIYCWVCCWVFSFSFSRIFYFAYHIFIIAWPTLSSSRLVFFCCSSNILWWILFFANYCLFHGDTRSHVTSDEGKTNKDVYLFCFSFACVMKCRFTIELSTSAVSLSVCRRSILLIVVGNTNVPISFIDIEVYLDSFPPKAFVILGWLSCVNPFESLRFNYLCFVCACHGQIGDCLCQTGINSNIELFTVDHHGCAVYCVLCIMEIRRKGVLWST